MKILIVISVLLLGGCFDDNSTEIQKTGVALGKSVFDKNCKICHGKAAQGLTKDWKKPLDDGSYLPPPLNGSAHTWHHSPKLLLNTINEGGAKLGGVMPAFKDKLNEEEKLAVLDYLYSLWPKDIQQKYNGRFK